MAIAKSFGFLMVATILAVFLQGTLLHVFLPDYLIPNFLVIIIVYLAFYEPNSRGAFLAFWVGLIFDFSSGILLGPWAGAAVVIFGIFSALSQRIFVESVLAAFLAVLVSSLVADTVFLAMIKGFLPGSTQVVSVSISRGLVSGLMAPLVLRAMCRSLGRGERASGNAFGGSLS